MRTSSLETSRRVDPWAVRTSNVDSSSVPEVVLNSTLQWPKIDPIGTESDASSNVTDTARSANLTTSRVRLSPDGRIGSLFGLSQQRALLLKHTNGVCDVTFDLRRRFRIHVG